MRLVGGEDLPWALGRIVDENGLETGFGALRGPLPLNAAGCAKVAAFLHSHRLIGITSRGPFPGHEPEYDALLAPDGPALPASNRPYPYAEQCEGWAHCFREPERYLPAYRPAILLSESDFKDPEWVWQAGCHGKQPQKQWDLIYVCGRNRLHEVTKNWALARTSISLLCCELRLRVLVVGQVMPDLDTGRGNVDISGDLPWTELMECIARSRIAFFPNTLDPSPRLLAEALCLDVPVLVNHGILGGWKYVAPDTGEFFAGEDDVVVAALAILVGSYSPRSWFSANHGPENASRRMEQLLQMVG
jgi:hypothetical protein